MPLPAPLLHPALPALRHVRSGKVREVYAVGEALLIVASDRISAFDYILGSGIPDKGKVLNQLSAFWFRRLADIAENHLLTTDVARFPSEVGPYADQLDGRAMLVRPTAPIPMECVARGYLSGSGWKEYRERGTVCGIALPPGLQESDRLPTPIFTPATKAESGHDINLAEPDAVALVGRDVFDRLRSLTLALYGRAAAHAERCGLILADTKFEFGWYTGAGAPPVLLHIDEALTPDSSRYWPRDQWRPGGPQPSFDKQYVRDYLEAIRWNKQPPVPTLPEDVVQRTRDKYLDAFRRLTGHDLPGTA